MKIAIQGIAGSFHHQAAETLINTNIDLVECTSFRDVFEAVSFGHADRGMAGIENSLYGSINATYDLLQKYDLRIVGEIYVHVEFGLFAIPGTTLDEITEIHSQAPALGECRETLAAQLPWANQREEFDTAASAKMVADRGEKTRAAISGYRAGEMYGLEAIAENIQDNPHNYTRFVLLSRNDDVILGANKSSLILKTDHSNGALYKALKLFADAGINLSKIESRPIPGSTWNYLFYVDIEASANSEPVQQAIKAMESNDYKVKVLGSYVQAQLPDILESDNTLP